MIKIKVREFLSNQYKVLVASCLIIVALGVVFAPKQPSEQPKTLTEEEREKLYARIEYEQKQRELAEKKPEFIIENQEGMMTKTHIISRGTLKNIGDLACKFVTLKVEYLDEDNNVLGTETQYVVGKEGIKPNGSQDFEVSTKITPSLKNAVDFKFIIMADYTVIN